MVNYKLLEMWAQSIVTTAVAGGYFTVPASDYFNKRLAAVADLAMAVGVQLKNYVTDDASFLTYVSALSVVYNGWFHTIVYNTLIRYGYTHVTTFNVNSSGGTTARTNVLNNAFDVVSTYAYPTVTAIATANGGTVTGGLSSADLQAALIAVFNNFFIDRAGPLITVGGIPVNANLAERQAYPSTDNNDDAIWEE